MTPAALMHSVPPTATGSADDGRGSIGEILVASGRLSPENAARVVVQQRSHKQPFGDAAIALKLATREDVDYALARQFDYAYLQERDQTLSTQLVAAYQPFSRVGENLRAVRSQIMLRWFSANPLHKVLAVVSPGQGDGRSFIAANLAVVFSQQGERTLLIDADLRSPAGQGQAALFKLGSGLGLSSILAGRAGLEIAQAVPGLPGLSVLKAGAIPPNPQELLGRLAFMQMLSAASQEFDVVLIDTPCGADYADADIIASRAGAALMVARKNLSATPGIKQLAQRLQQCDVALLGSVLNAV